MAEDKSPWGNSNDDDQNPWKPRRDNAAPPDIEVLLRKSQDKVRRIMGGKTKADLISKAFGALPPLLSCCGL